MQCVYQRYHWNSYDSQADIQKQSFQPDAVSSVVCAAWIADRSFSAIPARRNSADLLLALQSENSSFFRHRKIRFLHGMGSIIHLTHGTLTRRYDPP